MTKRHKDANAAQRNLQANRERAERENDMATCPNCGGDMRRDGNGVFVPVNRTQRYVICSYCNGGI